jgi:hypothetical protein
MTLPFLPAALVALLVAISSVLVDCALSTSGPSGTGATATTAPTAPTATPTPPPAVTVVVTVEQQGTVAAQDLHLVVTVAVTNHTNSAIRISIPFCNSPVPPVIIEVVNAESKTIWQTHLFGGSCPFISPRDAASLAPGETHRWTIENDLSHGSVEYGDPPSGPPPLVANASYTVRATVLQWHQGSVEDIGNPNVLQGQDVVGEAVVVLR